MVITIGTMGATSAILYFASGSATTSSTSISSSSTTSSILTSSLTSSSSSGIPTPVAPYSSTYQSCISSVGYVYCVEGNQTYFAPLTDTGIGNWHVTTSYPLYAGSCVGYSGYIYCVDGEYGGNASDSVYFAKLSETGIGDWSQTTNYPFAEAYAPTCFTSTGSIYCIGGNTTTPGTGGSNLVYQATVSSSGVGPWQQDGVYGYSGTTPVAVLNGAGPYVNLGSGPSCVVASGDAYCVGGADCYETISGPGCVADRFAFYASVNDGIQAPPGRSASPSPWANTTEYPDQPTLDNDYQDVNDLSCVASSGYIYCVGGGSSDESSNSTFFASVSDTGIGSWNATTIYPVDVTSASCVTSDGYIYCINGIAVQPTTGEAIPASYYAPLSSAGIGDWLPTSDF
jgi:hypothetical protein